MSENLLYMAIAAFVIGVVLFAISSKQRQDTGEWSNTLQWGYLLMMVGVFGVLAKYLSFTAVLLIFVLITGMIWGVSKMVRNKAKQDLAGRKMPEDKEARKILQQDAYEKRVGHFVDYMSGFFPIILIVFVLRTFVAEPFQIPSSSMRPGLVVGDFILVNKFNYGLRMPISNQVVIPVNKIDHGDVVVFAYPENESVSFIKRIVGLPGDTIEYRNKKLTINGKPVPQTAKGNDEYIENTPMGQVNVQPVVVEETLGKHTYPIYQLPQAPTFSPQVVRGQVLQSGACQYEGNEAFTCQVPAGHYFAMGDNRDNSDDSRYWGFVPDKNIVGKAFFVWMNFGDTSRIGTHIK